MQVQALRNFYILTITSDMFKLLNYTLTTVAI